jgi:hypothetical protein
MPLFEDIGKAAGRRGVCNGTKCRYSGLSLRLGGQ